jgi:hypothetical protein
MTRVVSHVLRNLVSITAANLEGYRMDLIQAMRAGYFRIC